MTESTELPDRTIPQSEAPAGARLLRRAWGKIKSALVRSVFWVYERGTWQYDLIVLAILAFIFLSPRSWFEDRRIPDSAEVGEVAHSKAAWTYLVDARLVESRAPQKPEDAIREIIRLRVQKPFTVKSIDPYHDRNNVILGYTVVVVLQ
jgi:hypothetical protein